MVVKHTSHSNYRADFDIGFLFNSLWNVKLLHYTHDATDFFALDIRNENTTKLGNCIFALIITLNTSANGFISF